MTLSEYRPEGVPAGVAVVAHGRNGATDQPQIQDMIGASLRRGWQVFAPDMCHSGANESAGGANGFTMAAHTADVAAVMAWLRHHGAAPAEAIALLGHSMGAYAVVRAAAAAPGEVRGLVAVSPVISGAALIRARRVMGEAAIRALREELPHAFTEWPQHDLAHIAPKVGVPTAVIVGADDTLTTPADAQILASWLPACVWSDVIPSQHHCPSGEAFSRSLDGALSRIAEG
ncbi:MAG: alpha/beta fold hydrolase [Pseudomonadota bacterium]